MNRLQYNNAVQDLLGLKHVSVFPLPEKMMRRSLRYIFSYFAKALNGPERRIPEVVTGEQLAAAGQVRPH